MEEKSKDNERLQKLDSDAASTPPPPTFSF